VAKTKGFIERHSLWNGEQQKAADAIRPQLDDLEMIRLSWPDQYGLLRGKSLTKAAFLSALEAGFEITMAPFFFDIANDIVYNPFIPGGGFGIPELSGSPNVIMVPDPTTFRSLPWAARTGWVLADLYLRDGRPFPFAPRSILKRTLDALHDDGYEFMAGLEVEWYLTRLIDPMLQPVQLGGPGNPAEPPKVMPVAHGYSYLLESHLDELDEVIEPLRRNLLGLGLPVRTIDDEWAPSQLETTFDVLPGLEAADAMVLFRTATKQIYRRLGYLATFMCQPAIPSFYSSGWHLHMSLADRKTGENAFIPSSETEPLSAVGAHFVAGLLEHAVAASVFTTPTVNGYRRRRPFSLAPDRATWGFDNRAAMIRVISSGPGDRSAHIENRVGEPAANPYLYLASQVAAGRDGVNHKVDPPPMSDEPYAETDRPLLPVTLWEAVEVLRNDAFHREHFGDAFVDYLVRMKENEVTRFRNTVSIEDGAGMPAEVTPWEHREYFELF
jgi:glutamine synthetase